MTAGTHECPADQRLRLLLEDPDGHDATVEDHLEWCADCRTRLSKLAAAHQWEKLLGTALHGERPQDVRTALQDRIR